MQTVGQLYTDLIERHRQVQHDLAEVEKLIPEFENLLNACPEEVGILFSLGTCRMQLHQNGTAIALLEKAGRIAPGIPEIWNNLGNAYKQENNNAKAEEYFRKALDLREDADYYNNIATLYVNEGCPEKGVAYAEKGLAIDPEHPRLNWNYGLMLLEQGQWEKGFEKYDYGLKSADRPDRDYGVPEWNGEPGRVVVYGEQGMGDEIMFAACLPDLIAEADDVVFDCHPRLINIFKRSFGVKCHGTRKDAVWTWHEDEPVDYKIAVGSLFRRYGMLKRAPYLVPDESLVAQYRAKLEALGPGPYVGIGWRAGHKKTNSHYRSFKLSAFKPVLDVGGTFVSLQYLHEEGKCERFKKEGYTVHHWPEIVESDAGGFDYDKTLALLAALDLCILPNTTAVHACGAIGKECWTLTPPEPAWRYQLEGTEMPMYESVYQFRNYNFGEIANVYRDYRTRAEPVGAAAG